MTLQQLKLDRFRNFPSSKFTFHPHFNIISGLNGRGKTSLLEAIYLLSCAKSFRTHEISALVMHGESSFTLHAKHLDDTKIALQKSLVLPSVIRFNESSSCSAVDLARFIPTQIFYQDIFQIVDAGPSVRRSVLDWGLFHVKHQYYDVWKNYRRALKQRNSLIRQNGQIAEIAPWDELLANLGHELDLMRQAYLTELAVLFESTLSELTDLDCKLEYYRGWGRRDENLSLREVLRDSLSGDRQYKYTRYGAHQADLLLVNNEHRVKHALSRGQQKLILFALKIAQVLLLDRTCIYLIDDLFAEFDHQHAYKLLNYMVGLKGQFFVTCHHGLPKDIGFDENLYQQIWLPETLTPIAS